MMEYINKIMFPAIDLSVVDWNGEIINEIIYFDEFFYSSSEKDFNELRLNHKIVDSNGDIFQITGNVNIAWWRKYIPFVAKKRMIFKKQNESMTIDEIKSFMKERVIKLEGEKKVFLEHIYAASSIKELIQGKE